MWKKYVVCIFYISLIEDHKTFLMHVHELLCKTILHMQRVTKNFSTLPDVFFQKRLDLYQVFVAGTKLSLTDVDGLLYQSFLQAYMVKLCQVM